MIARLLGYRIRRWVLVCVCCLAAIGGLVLARQMAFFDGRWLWLCAPFVALSLRRQNAVTLVLLALIFCGAGWWRGTVYMDRLAMQQAFYHRKVQLVGRVTEDAVYGSRYQLEFSMANAVIVKPAKQAMVGSLTIRGFGEAAVYRGDIVQVEGQLFPTRGNNLASISFAKLHVVERDTSWINHMRRSFAAGMQSALPEPVASFGLGLLIGQRNTLPETTSDQLRHVGLTHIIAVSGYNLTIIVLACRRLFVKRSKFQATAACLGLIGLFLLFTGSSPPIVRAGIISVLTILTWYHGRAIKPLPLILLAAAVTALANPLYVWGNVSWYLSFLAFFGVLVLAPLITRRLLGGREPGVLPGIVIESMCASALVLPYILFIFGELSLVSLPANVLVVPFIPVAMMLSFVSGLAGMTIPAVAGWLAWPAKALMTYMLDVANAFSRIPHAFVQNVGFSLTGMILFYGAIALVCVILWRKTRTKGGIITDNTEAKEGA